MRAIWYEDQGPVDEVLTLGETPEPSPGPGEVAVYVEVSGVNPSDVKQRSGARGPMAVARQIPHSDGAGVIKAVGEGVDPSRIGERVWLYNAAFKRAGGTCAEVCVSPTELAVPLPDDISFEAGACLGIPALTAHRALFCGSAVKGKRVLVTGGAGMVGHTAIQLAKWAGAAQVLTTVSSPEKAQTAWAAGADEVIDYTAQDVAEAVRAVTGGAGVDHIVEVEFGANLSVSSEIIAEHGTIAAYGSEGEKTPELKFYDLMFKNVRIQPVFLYRLTSAQRAQGVWDVTRALVDGVLTPLIDQVYDIEDTASAHDHVERGKLGAVLVRV
ncbi:NADPH:quinone reductase [Maricaulaceae bacterium MS644]